MKVDTKILVSVNEDAQIVIEVDDQVYDGVGVVRMGPLVMSRASSAAIAARRRSLVGLLSRWYS